MEKQITFWIVVASFVFYLLAAPVKHLWTGEIRFNKLAYPDGRTYRRDREPEKFYFRVALDFLFIIAGIGLTYWVMFVLAAEK